MSASAWRLVRLPSTGPAPVVRGWKPPVKRLIFQVAERLRGRFGVRVFRLPGRVVVLAESVDALRAGVHRGRPVLERRVGRVSLLVGWWRGPWRGWSGRIAPVRHVVGYRVRTPRGGRGPATVDLRVEWPVAAAELVSAASAALIAATGTEVTPRGRRFEADQPGAQRFRLEFADRRPLGLQPWRRGQGETVSWPLMAALRGVGVLECAGPPGRDPGAEAALLAGLARTGVVLHAEPPAAVRALLPPSLVDIIGEPLPDPGGVLDLEVRSVRQRREALRTDAPTPAVSALLATRRPEHLDRILPAIAGQTYPDLEIVLCLHGIDLPESIKHLLDTCGRPYEIVPVDAGVAFGTALGVATARCRGALLTKFDDDDTYGPEHVWDLVLARHYSAATLVGKGAEFIYLEDADVTVRRFSGTPESDDVMVAGGTMLIATADLEALGGWRPVARSVDRGLIDRVNRAGAAIYRTHPLGYLYHRRPAGHTWDPGTEYFLRHTRQRWDGLLRHPEFGTD